MPGATAPAAAARLQLRGEHQPAGSTGHRLLEQRGVGGLDDVHHAHVVDLRMHAEMAMDLRGIEPVDRVRRAGSRGREVEAA